MKILLLSHVSDYVGGAERSILDVVDTWKRDHGVEVEFILRKPLGSYVVELQKRGYKYHAVDYTYWSDSNPPRDKERLYTTSLRNTRAILKIEEIIKKVQPDVVITNSIVAPWAAFAAYYQQIPHVWFAREYGDLDHGREFEIGQSATFQDIGTLSCLVIANSLTLAEHIGQFIDKEKTTVLYNPFDIKNIQRTAQERTNKIFKDPRSLKLILTSGGITPSKGQREAITAVGMLNKKGFNVEIALAGRPGPSDYMAELHGLVEKYGISSKVHFIGYQTNSLACAKQADIGLMTSKQEAFGRVTFEYLAIGKPVIGADSGATPELVDDTINGQLYTSGDIDDLAKKIQIYADNKALLEEHSKMAKKKAQAMMSGNWKVEDAYKSMMKSLKGYRPSTDVLNYTHRWLEYPEIAKDYMESVDSLSMKAFMKIRLKTRLRPHYQKVRGLYAKITGK